jgi:hypothetical protein
VADGFDRGDYPELRLLAVQASDLLNSFLFLDMTGNFPGTAGAFHPIRTQGRSWHAIFPGIIKIVDKRLMGKWCHWLNAYLMLMLMDNS